MERWTKSLRLSAMIERSVHTSRRADMYGSRNFSLSLFLPFVDVGSKQKGEKERKKRTRCILHERTSYVLTSFHLLVKVWRIGWYEVRKSVDIDGSSRNVAIKLKDSREKNDYRQLGNLMNNNNQEFGDYSNISLILESYLNYVSIRLLVYWLYFLVSDLERLHSTNQRTSILHIDI